MSERLEEARLIKKRLEQTPGMINPNIIKTVEDRIEKLEQGEITE